MRNDLKDIRNYQVPLRHDLMARTLGTTRGSSAARLQSAKDGAAQRIGRAIELVFLKFYQEVVLLKVKELDSAIQKKLPSGGSAVVVVTIVQHAKEVGIPQPQFIRAEVIGFYPDTKAAKKAAAADAPTRRQIETLNEKLCNGTVPREIVEKLEEATTVQEFTKLWFATEDRYCRMNVAPVLIRRQVAKDAQAAFKKYANPDVCSISDARRGGARRGGAALSAARKQGPTVGRRDRSLPPELEKKLSRNVASLEWIYIEVRYDPDQKGEERMSHRQTKTTTAGQILRFGL